MKVVLFCGGQGMRLREYSERIPKPLVPVGRQPIMWNLMRYYAHFGHQDFVLCLGHAGVRIKEFFLDYQEALTNDFVLSGNKKVELLGSDTDGWRITFVDTGLHSNIGMRLRAVKKHVENEEVFLANYSDGLSDLPLDRYIDWFLRSDKIAAFVSVAVPYAFHVVELGTGGLVTRIEHVGESKMRINGGFFVLRREIFDYLEEGEELVLEPFARLIEKQLLVAYPYDGFWRSMDTFKDKQNLDELALQGTAPWELWKESRSG